MPETHTVRTTLNPTVEIEVGPAEYTDLRRQGLLHTEAADAGSQGGGEAEGDVSPPPAYHAAPGAADARKARKAASAATVENEES